MYENIELERLRQLKEQLKCEIAKHSIEVRFKCLEMARNTSADNNTILLEAKKFLEFVESK